MQCFCLDIFAKAIFINDGINLRLRLTGLEIEDISPEAAITEIINSLHVK